MQLSRTAEFLPFIIPGALKERVNVEVCLQGKKWVHIACCALSLLLTRQSHAQPAGHAATAYVGFDRNDYPGDASLAVLRRSFRYTSYWLNTPPGDAENGWAGKRAVLMQHDFGFMVLFNGRLDAQLKGLNAAALGTVDGKAAEAAAVKEGFPQNVLIYLDQEEGGRLLPEQLAYVFAWIDAVRSAGAQAGVYCSGIEVQDGSSQVSTAEDIVQHERVRSSHEPVVPLWVANDQCPPAPGCAAAAGPVRAGFPESLKDRGAAAGSVWQYAQSPRRAQFSAGCPRNNDADGNCYAPGLPHGPGTFVDLNMANSPDPSGGRK